MASGIKIYKKKRYNGFNNSEENIKFTLIMNNMFDKKFPAEKIIKNSQE